MPLILNTYLPVDFREERDNVKIKGKIFVQNFPKQGEFCDERNRFAVTFDLVAEMSINIGDDDSNFPLIFSFEKH